MVDRSIKAGSGETGTGQSYVYDPIPGLPEWPEEIPSSGLPWISISEEGG
jgi:hypothetical protein